MDGITLKTVLDEINTLLTGGVFRKIYDMGEDSFIFQFYNGYEYDLFIKYAGHNNRIHLCDTKQKDANTPGSFCMLMRKHLQGKKLFKSFNRDFSKTAEFLFGDGKSVFKLFIVLVEKEANIILTDEKEKILGSARTLPAKNRTLDGIFMASPLPGYKKHLSDVKEAKDLAFLFEPSSRPNIKKELNYHFTGLSDSTLDLLLQNNSDLGHEKLYSEIQKFLRNIEEKKLKPCIVKNQEKENYYLWPPKGSHNFECFSSVNDMLCVFYNKTAGMDEFEKRKKEIYDKLKKDKEKTEKRIQAIRSDLDKLNKASIYKIYGELILSNIYLIKPKDTLLETQNFYSEELETIQIELDPTLSGGENAQKYFEKYKKAQRGIPVLTERLNESTLHLRLVEETMSDLNTSKNDGDLDLCRERFNWQSNKVKKEDLIAKAPRKFYFKNYEILAGRNPAQNDELSLKIAGKQDLWFHTRSIPGSHVIIRNKQGEKTPSEVIVKAATVAAWFSKAKTSAKVPVSYTFAKNVSKKKGMPPGMVTIKDEMTIIVNPLDYDFQEWLKINSLGETP